MNVVRVKDGVQFTTIAPGGFRILAAVDGAAASVNHDVTITSACDGCHSGLHDPHHRGEAYDVRTHDQADKNRLLAEIMKRLAPDQFFGFLEAAGTDNEHIHVQVRKGTVYP
jgi:hypothetical protein